MEFNLFDTLNRAYGATTHNNNSFKTAIEKVEWDNIFKADGETYYCKGGFSLIVENLNPFEEEWKPTVMFSDGSMMELGL